MLILIFFILSALLIVSNNNLALYDKGNLEKFSELYFNWVNQLYLNGQLVTGQVIKMEWWPQSLE